ncbi:hypothetical protein DICPUDRAFT_149516 [Dictyostelium purpureum]|uniref:Uncharacterized protein n=1 Tax=Dictyostelium purpureum TaxID=5786 RepID=F0ZDY5_DICPU|nr:uncharacterized protein DICPUDRAFT_149516 [Dictyostelium purpureum]EGC37879.1 hypothetical protein DICPUDRAFT_149516 [Dictyostelium purpureum]|eukprot:XP_003285629.1 hypothetical protein DICPUDRAFT_149516 [Dictyostelium purpureum]
MICVSNDAFGFFEYINNNIKNLDNNLNVENLYKSFSHPSLSSTYQQYPNYIPYNEAIQVFKLFDNLKDNQVARVYIVIQFFKYYLNKKDRNEKEIHKFISKVILDKSTMVNECYKYLKTISNRNCNINNIFFILDKIFKDKSRLEELRLTSSTEDLSESKSKFQNKSFIKNLELLLDLKSIQTNNTQVFIQYFQKFIDSHPPTSISQLYFYNLLYDTLSKMEDPNLTNLITTLQSYKPIIKGLFINNKRPYNEITIEEPLKSKKKLKPNVTTSANNDRKEIYLYNLLIQKIIGYILYTNKFLKWKIEYQPIDPKPKEKIVSSVDKRREIFLSTSLAIMSLASVSKRFHYNLGRVLEDIDWSTYKYDKFLTGQISFGKPFSLFQKPFTNIRYDTLIRTTPYEFIDYAFAQVENLIIVGDAINVKEGCSNNDYNIYDIGYTTFPPTYSFPFLTKLTVLGRATKCQSYKVETGGLYLIKYILSNTGCKIEEFTIINQQSLYLPDEFDTSIINNLLEYHSSTLKTVRLKYSCKAPQKHSFVSKMIELLEPFKTIHIELYQGKYKYKNPFIFQRLTFDRAEIKLRPSNKKNNNNNNDNNKKIKNNNNNNINNNNIQYDSIQKNKIFIDYSNTNVSGISTSINHFFNNFIPFEIKKNLNNRIIE